MLHLIPYLRHLLMSLRQAKKFTKDPAAREQGDSEARVDSLNGYDLPPVNFERDTGWPASQYAERVR